MVVKFWKLRVGVGHFTSDFATLQSSDLSHPIFNDLQISIAKVRHKT